MTLVKIMSSGLIIYLEIAFKNGIDILSLKWLIFNIVVLKIRKQLYKNITFLLFLGLPT